MTDFIESLGPAFTAHRLRRVSDFLLDATAKVLEERGFRGPPRSVSMLLLLREQGALSVTDIAAQLRFSHPMIIKLAKALATEGLISESADPKDSRRRLLVLTQLGHSQTAIAEDITIAVATAVLTKKVDLLGALEQFMAATKNRPFEEDIVASLNRNAKRRRKK